MGLVDGYVLTTIDKEDVQLSILKFLAIFHKMKKIYSTRKKIIKSKITHPDQ
jgi:hypothetical protein